MHAIFNQPLRLTWLRVSRVELAIFVVTFPISWVSINSAGQMHGKIFLWRSAYLIDGGPLPPLPTPPRPSLSFWILNANSLSIFRLLPIRLNWSILAGRDAASIENLINLLDKRLIINNIRKDTGTSTIKYRQIMSSSDKSQHCLFFFSPSVCLCFNVIQNGE